MYRKNAQSRTPEEIEELNRTVRPVFKRHFFGYMYLPMMDPSADYRGEKPVGRTGRLTKLRTIDIKLPLRGYKGDFVLSTRNVYNQLTDAELRGVDYFYVQPTLFKDNYIKQMESGMVDAKVTLLQSKTKQSKERIK